jgi:hypothetical protein
LRWKKSNGQIRYGVIICTLEPRDVILLIKQPVNSLAHNLIVWARRWLSATTPQLKEYGFLRLVRDAFQVCGLVELDTRGQVLKIILNQKSVWAKRCINALKALLKPMQVMVILDET